MGHGEGAAADLDHDQELACGVHGGPHPGGRALQALDGFVVADCTRFAVAQHRVHLVELQLLQVEGTEEIRGKSPQLFRRFAQPVQDGVGSDLEHPRRGANT